MRYILLNKPRGYVTTRRDPQGRPTVMDLLKSVREYVYPVGRLDYDSEGLLLLTNDGDLAARLTHPRHEVERVYEARVRGVPDSHALDRLAQGVVIDDRRTAPARVELLESRDDQAIVHIALHEGRQRQVRHMFDAVGHPVIRLRRVRIGPIADENLTTGYWRELTPGEIARVRRAAGLS
jgi:pseudouridine synthase